VTKEGRMGNMGGGVGDGGVDAGREVEKMGGIVGGAG